MEKNQHNREGSQGKQQNENIPVAAPGQEVPQKEDNTRETAASPGEERHSESSLPQSDAETLGTP